MFRTLKQDDATNTLIVQGARAQNNHEPIGTVLFQNFDKDTQQIYPMAAISMYDAFGTQQQNGYGELGVRINTTGHTSNLQEVARFSHKGHLGIGCSNPSYPLEVQGLVASRGILVGEAGPIVPVPPPSLARSATWDHRTPKEDISGTWTTVFDSTSEEALESGVYKCEICWKLSGPPAVTPLQLRVVLGEDDIRLEAPASSLTTYVSVWDFVTLAGGQPLRVRPQILNGSIDQVRVCLTKA